MMPTPRTLMLRTTSGSNRIERNPYLATSEVFRARVRLARERDIVQQRDYCNPLEKYDCPCDAQCQTFSGLVLWRSNLTRPLLFRLRCVLSQEEPSSVDSTN